MKKHCSLLLCACLFALISAGGQNYGLSEAGKNLVCTGLTDTGGKDKLAFSNAMIWCINAGTGIADTFVSRDFSGYKFSAKLRRSSKDNEKNSISFVLKIQVRDNQLSYSITEIKVYDTFLPIPQSIEKFYPPKKAKQEEIIAWVTDICSETMNDLTAFIHNNHPVFSEHWDAICRKAIEPGMTADECVLVMGKPINRQNSGNREQWMYENSTYIIFEDGVVKTLLD